ncbi:hypothetical protein ACFQ3R_03090 [Mesonia ostreae]|uniref:Lipoprotein n=1 Tax=Mesonia ostreae TaxID=861110 RepID=A0ABU2KKK0_9FLAO|nr:hypothetical protein [Mesonia ostreae]MDT0295221.1 hypothetical protein [Mesonia ostreae]
MKKVKIFLVLAFVSLSIISCNKDDDNDSSSSSNFLKVGDSEYTLKAGVIEDYGSFSTGVYNFDVLLTTSKLTTIAGEVLPQDEIFSGIYFELFTANENNLEEGVYNFSTSGEANTFEYGDIIIDATIGESEPTYYEITGGSFEVLDNGNTYNLKFEGMMENGQSFSGAYRGSLTKIVDTFEGKGTTSTKTRAFSRK